MSTEASGAKNAKEGPNGSGSEPPHLEGSLRTSDQEQDKIVLVTWEHQDILFIKKSDQGRIAEIILVNPDVCTSGTFYPPAEFSDRFIKLKNILQQCEQGQGTFLDFLKKLGYFDHEIQLILENVQKIEYTFL